MARKAAAVMLDLLNVPPTPGTSDQGQSTNARLVEHRLSVCLFGRLLRPAFACLLLLRRSAVLHLLLGSLAVQCQQACQNFVAEFIRPTVTPWLPLPGTCLLFFFL